MDSKQLPCARRTVAVVDPRPSDYADLLDCALGAGVRIEFFASGRDAMRFSQTGSADLWVINADLPDMSGVDLCTMLRTHASDPVVYIVTDEYRPEVEKAARACSGSLFVCKPIRAQWLKTCFEWSRPAAA